MKKLLTIFLVVILAFSLIACDSETIGNNESSDSVTPSEDTSEDTIVDTSENTSEDTSSDESNTSDSSSTPEVKQKVALVIPTIGGNQFLDLAVNGFKETSEANGLEYTVAECDSAAAFEENCNALVNEEYNLIIGVGWECADAINKIATEYPDAAKYAMVDTTVEAENVKCISFYEQEGAYIIGVLAALTVDGESHDFGYVGVTQSAFSWKWRCGYMKGVLSIDPDARFAFNYVGSYSDPATAKELALQQYALGCMFINSAAVGGDFGVFEAALEKGFYTSGQDVDLTTPDNEYIVSCQIKDTYASVAYVINEFVSGDWDFFNETLAVADGAIGAVNVTHETTTPRSERLSDEDITQLIQVVQDIKDGKINLRELPEEEDYEYNAVQ